MLEFKSMACRTRHLTVNTYCISTLFALMQIINAFRALVSSCIKMRVMVATYEVVVSAQYSFWHTTDTQ